MCARVRSAQPPAPRPSPHRLPQLGTPGRVWLQLALAIRVIWFVKAHHRFGGTGKSAEVVVAYAIVAAAYDMRCVRGRQTHQS